MPDSITPAYLPGGYPAYLGYVDGRWPTAATLKALHPSAHILTLTVFGGNAVADGCDIETGDLTPAAGAAWIAGRLAAGASRPVAYASVSVMSSVLAALSKHGIARGQVRLLAAHYGAGEHICGPSSCHEITTGVMDGTQWTDQFKGVNGAPIDMSVLSDNFFGTVTGDWVFDPVRGLTVVSVGPSSVKLSWQSPGTPMPLGVGSYQITVRLAGQDVQSYPRMDPKHSDPEEWQGGSLKPGTEYTALVRAVATDGGHASPWATVAFKTT